MVSRVGPNETSFYVYRMPKITQRVGIHGMIDGEHLCAEVDCVPDDIYRSLALCAQEFLREINRRRPASIRVGDTEHSFPVDVFNTASSDDETREGTTGGRSKERKRAKVRTGDVPKALPLGESDETGRRVLEERDERGKGHPQE